MAPVNRDSGDPGAVVEPMARGIRRGPGGTQGNHVIWNALIGIVAGLLLMWLALIAALWAVKGRVDLTAPQGGLRLLPDLVRLLRRLAADPTLPRGVRV